MITGRHTRSVSHLLRQKYAAHLVDLSRVSHTGFHTGLPALDRLFPRGIPFGHLIELTGAPSCGKTHLVFHFLSQLPDDRRSAYVDTGNMFFPPAARAAGVDTDRLILVKPGSLPEALRTTELLLRHAVAECIVCDLAGAGRPLALSWLHRLRTHTLRRQGLVFFLTEPDPPVIPPSMVSLRLEVARLSADAISVTVTKSRICPEHVRAEVTLDA